MLALSPSLAGSVLGTAAEWQAETEGRERVKSLFKRKIITGCEERGDGDVPYMTRWILLETRFGNLYLHVFHRSDYRVFHDHPWDFVSLILWRGYIEDVRREQYIPSVIYSVSRKWPGMLLFRRAEHQHHVVLINEKPAVSLVFTRPKRRIWGFIIDGQWESFKEYFRKLGCTDEPVKK
jgi:hypothetical protein